MFNEGLRREFSLCNSVYVLCTFQDQMLPLKYIHTSQTLFLVLEMGQTRDHREMVGVCGPNVCSVIINLPLVIKGWELQASTYFTLTLYFLCFSTPALCEGVQVKEIRIVWSVCLPTCFGFSSDLKPTSCGL